jgi:hypothetical protein
MLNTLMADRVTKQSNMRKNANLTEPILVFSDRNRNRDTLEIHSN